MFATRSPQPPALDSPALRPPSAMTAVSSPFGDQQYSFWPSSESPLPDDARQSVEGLQIPDPEHAVDAALELQLERARGREALRARDAVVQRLADAYTSIRQKSAMIALLQTEIAVLRGTDPAQVGARDSLMEALRRGEEVRRLEGTVAALQGEIKALKETQERGMKSATDPPPRYEDGMQDLFKNDIDHPRLSSMSPILPQDMTRVPYRVLRDIPLPTSRPSSQNTGSESPRMSIEFIKGRDPAELIKSRNDILAALPVPPDIPEDSLRPIIIPSPYTLHEFLGMATGSLRLSLSNYRVFQQLTTSWCTEREEHGYLLTPLYKCNTNPRVATAHRWAEVDVLARMKQPTECFYNKDGKWYYAGVYVGFRLPDLTPKEWDALSPETTQALVKDTLAGRKNTSPQNVYEATQLYAAGALRAACVGLQCVGFSGAMYRAVLAQADACAASGAWKSGAGAGALWSPGLSGVSAGGEEVAEAFRGLSVSGGEGEGEEGAQV